MMGGYYSYQGLNGGARYHRTAVEEVLPVTLLPYDDRVEVPEGFRPEIVQVNHPIMAGITGTWPILLGYNEVRLKTEANVTLIARVPDEAGGNPFAGDRGVRKRTNARLDNGYCPPLVAAGIRGVVRVCTSLDPGPRLAHEKCVAD